MVTKAEREEQEEREARAREAKEKQRDILAKQEAAADPEPPTSKDTAKETRQHELTRSQDWREYRSRKTVVVRPYRLGEDISQVLIEEKDRRAGHPLAGDLIARDSDGRDLWLIPAPEFATRYELIADQHLVAEVKRLTEELETLRAAQAKREAERLQADWPREVKPETKQEAEARAKREADAKAKADAEAKRAKAEAA
jgi:NADH dehydrogenase [ubiquinone] 1 alpha subcomplex assembly factor 7